MELNILGSAAKSILIWSVGSAVSLLVANEIRRILVKISDNVVAKIKTEISTIQDQNLKEAARHVVRYIATQLPDSTGSTKLESAIKKLQEITPDILVSDDKLKVLIESAYLDFKMDLKQI